MKLLKRTWADVSLDALAHNYHAIRGISRRGANS